MLQPIWNAVIENLLISSEVSAVVSTVIWENKPE